MMTDSTIVKVNEYEVHSWYEGITAYHIVKDGKQVYHGWEIADVVRIVGCNPFEK